MTPKVVVVGGGLSGCSTAIKLAQRGVAVLLLEKDSLPRDKLCGEFLSGEGEACFASLGVQTHIEALGTPRIQTARFTVPSGKQAVFRLPAPARGISRWALDALLFEHAKSLGVQALSQARVDNIEPLADGARVHFEHGGETEHVDAPWVVVAHGRRAHLDRVQQRSFFARNHPYMGLKQHHEARDPVVDRELQGRVELHVFRGGYLGMSHVESGRINVCSLVHGDLAQSEGFDLARLAQACDNPEVARRLGQLQPVGVRLAVAEVPLEGKEAVGPRVLYVGDAAGMVAPLAGDGQVVALAQGIVLAGLLARAPAQPSEAERKRLNRTWQRHHRAGFAPARWMARGLQALLLSPAAGVSVAVLGRHPAVPQWLARTTRVRPSWDDTASKPW